MRTAIKITRREGMAFTLMLAVIAMIASGCSKPTYPAARIEESVVKLCKNEYNISVRAKLQGSTFAVYMPFENLFDANLALSEEASDHLNDVLLSISRISLSTDADLQFYILIVQDPRIPDVQMIVIKSVDDLRKFFYGGISRNEYFKRMLYDVNFTPQAQKEKLIKNLFVNLDIEGIDEALDMYLRKVGISSINDIGYWNDEFFIKDITLTEFFSKQIESRIRMEFRADKELAEKYRVIEIVGRYDEAEETPQFRISANIRPTKMPTPEEKTQNINDVLEACLKVSSDVLSGYKFENFDHVEIFDNLNASKIYVEKEALFQFSKRKMQFSDFHIQSF